MDEQHEKERILYFWFGDSCLALAACPPEENEPGIESGDRPAKWFAKDEVFDQAIRERFEPEVEAALAGEKDYWQDTPEGALALLLLLDQFPRNIYRGTAKAFAGDARALMIARQALAVGFDRELPPIARIFLYLPLEHAEESGTQKESVRRFQVLFEEVKAEGESDTLVELARTAYDYALRHAEIIERFGRFPHRNKILGRVLTKEEKEFLKEPNSSF